MTNIANDDNDRHLEWTCEIVASYVANNTLPPADVAGFIQGIHSSIASIASPKTIAQPAPQSVPALPRSSAKVSQPAPQTLEQPAERQLDQALEQQPVEPPIAENKFPDLPVTRAISLPKSIASPEHIISMIDGKAYKSLTRQLNKYGMTPDDYRAHFKLPDDYPIIAPAYSEARRKFAFKNNFGAKGRQPKKK